VISAERAAQECRRGSGRQFDAAVVEALERVRAAGRLPDGGPAARR